MNNPQSIIKRNPYSKYCVSCEVFFKPTGKYQKLCSKCQINGRKQRDRNAQKTIDKKKTLTKFNGGKKNDKR